MYIRIVDVNDRVIDALNETDKITQKNMFMEIASEIFKIETDRIDDILLKIAAETGLTLPERIKQ